MARSSTARVNRRIAALVAASEVPSVAPDTDTPVAGIGDNNPPPDAPVAPTVPEPVAIPEGLHVPESAAELGVLFSQEESAAALHDEHKGKRFSGVLLFALTHAEHVKEWRVQYEKYDPVDGVIGKDGQAKKREARVWFGDMFEIPKADTGEGKERGAIVDRILSNVHFVLTLHDNDHLSAFTFNQNGRAFIHTSSDLGKFVWKKKGWDDKPLLVSEAPETIMIVDRTTQAIPGRIAWSTLQQMVLNAEKGDGASDSIAPVQVGSQSAPVAQTQTISSNNASEALKRGIEMRINNPPKGENKFNEQKDMLKQGMLLVQVSLTEISTISAVEDLLKQFQAFQVNVWNTLKVAAIVPSNDKPQIYAANNGESEKPKSDDEVIAEGLALVSDAPVTEQAAEPATDVQVELPKAMRKARAKSKRNKRK